MNVENANIYVITTKFVIKDDSPIVTVFHDDDGDWQFLGKESNLNEEDAMVVSLNEILKFDLSIQKVLSLPIGCKAHRLNKDDVWVFDI